MLVVKEEVEVEMREVVLVSGDEDGGVDDGGVGVVKEEIRSGVAEVAELVGVHRRPRYCWS